MTTKETPEPEDGSQAGELVYLVRAKGVRGRKLGRPSK